MGSILFQPFVITHSFSNLQESGFPYHLIEAVLLKFPPDHRKNQWALISPHPSQPIFAFNSVIFLLSGTLSSPTHSDSIPVLPSLVHFPLTENIWMWKGGTVKSDSEDRNHLYLSKVWGHLFLMLQWLRKTLSYTVCVILKEKLFLSYYRFIINIKTFFLKSWSNLV